MSDVVVVGAGLGGLSAAIETRLLGHRVKVVEALDRPGGKASTTRVEGIEVDTGPSLLTLPHVFDELLWRAGSRLRDEVELIELCPSFRYQWPDGTVLDVFPRLDRTLASVETVLGPAARRELARFARYAEAIYRAADDRFVRGHAPRLVDVLDLRVAPLLVRIDPLRSMAAAIRSRVRNPYLRDVLLRFATYNGSDPRRAPATLNCIAHVDLAQGGFGVRGGIHALVQALFRAGQRLGVEYRFGERVVEIQWSRDRVFGVRYASGSFERADAVVANCDVAHLSAELMPKAKIPGRGRPPSMSAYNAIVRAKLSASKPSNESPRVAHTVLFPSVYADEFRDIFDAGRMPLEPTVYLCAASVAHRRARWPDAEPLFAMVNAPALPAGWRGEPRYPNPRPRMMSRLVAAGLVDPEDRVVWERSPEDLARRFPGSRGALYGAASSDLFSAFRRPPNRVRHIPGLYLASGSAHPGGGMPLCVLSGRAAANALAEDFGAPHPRRAPALGDAKARPIQPRSDSSG